MTALRNCCPVNSWTLHWVRVQVWRSENPDRPFVRAWERVLPGDASSVAAFLVDRSQLGEELRQSSPFAGVLDARERWRIWRETRTTMSGES